VCAERLQPARSTAYLEENVAAGDVALDTDALARLDAIYDPSTDPIADAGDIDAFFEKHRP
jgi:hypothetical protein